MIPKYELKCPKCGKNRIWENRKRDLKGSRAMCFFCNNRFTVHSHIDKQTTIVRRVI